MDAEMKEFQRWLNRHLVSLVLVYWHLDENGNSKDRPLIAACSGFVMTLGESWFLVTAGHVLEELDRLVGERFVKVVDSFLMDSLGSQAKHKNHIPFTYEAEDGRRAYLHSQGLDYGLIMLNSNERRLLEANEIVPVTVEHWWNQDIERCEAFALIGIPVDWVSHERRDHSDGINIGTLIVSLKRLREPPPGAEKTEYERFMGEMSICRVA